MQLKRLGGQIHYATYFRGVVGASTPLRVEVEAIRLKDFDSAFSEAVPFVFHFNLEDQSFVFSVVERPEVMARPWE